MSAPPTRLDASNPLLALSGTVLESRYELGRVLGTGGMGAVFEAKHLKLDRTVAIKILRPVFVGHDEYVKRFLREAKVASKIRHRNVVEILDFGEAAGGLVYSVMELLRGHDLDKHLRAQPDNRLPWPQACALLVQIATGLRAAHAGGIIHRDIKPANCFLTTDEDGQLVKLVDFGIAKVDDAEQTQQLTSTSEMLGTPSYIAPELVMSKQPASPRSDVYSLGVLAYRMLTGHVPFTGETTFHVLHRACFEPVPPMREHAPELPPAAEAFVLQMLAKSPDDRPQDMQAVRNALLDLGRDSIEGLAAGITGSGTRPFAPAEPSNPLGGSTLLVHEEDAPTMAMLPPPREASATLPSISGTALPLQDATGTTEVPRPGRRRMAWLGVGGIAVALAVGVVVVQKTAAPPSEPEPERLSTPEAERVSEPEPVRVLAPNESAGASLAPPPASTAPPPTSLAPPPAAQPTPVEPEIPADEPETLPPAEPETPPAPAKPTTKPMPSKPTGPPSDAALTKKLVGRIKTKCADVLAGQSIKVSFIVLAEGKLTAVGAAPKGPAAQCAVEQVKGTAFRKRSEPAPIDFVVK